MQISRLPVRISADLLGCLLPKVGKVRLHSFSSPIGLGAGLLANGTSEVLRQEQRSDTKPVPKMKMSMIFFASFNCNCNLSLKTSTTNSVPRGTERCSRA